ncbi:MAG: hypothetical protein ACRDFC_01690 [Ignavibacteria bacterium]
MNSKEFLNRVANSKVDFIENFFFILRKNKIKYCVIGGLSVNAYAEPVVSLDMDVVVVSEKLSELLKIIKKHFKVKRFEHSINISAPQSDIRIQIQTDPKYQQFIKDAKLKSLLGYKLSVAKIEDVLKGKIWAYSDKTRRASKRQKDLSDIMRLIEAKKSLFHLLPEQLKKKFIF